jgi:mRNA-degrading endonuclease RelE of RelBE toxin-antitoxin system
MPWTIAIEEQAISDLEQLRKYDRQMVREGIRSQLAHEPTVATRKRKIITGLDPSFHYVPPLWQLRVGDYRVFYDVDETAQVVRVRAIRHKTGGVTTEEIV